MGLLVKETELYLSFERCSLLRKRQKKKFIELLSEKKRVHRNEAENLR